MNIMIYIIIFVLFAVLLIWTWKSENDFENKSSKIIFLIIGIIILSFITLIIFNISKIGIQYPNNDILREVRKMALLIFIPVNGYLSLPHFASIKSEISEGIDDKKTKRKILILFAVLVIWAILEIKYLKEFQNGIIQILSSK